MIRRLTGAARWLVRQCRDLFVFWLLPFTCFLLPVAWANRVLHAFAGCRWLFRATAEPAWENARRLGTDWEEEAWKRRFRMVHLIDGVDLWHGFLSSDRRIAKRLVTVEGAWPEQDQGVVFLGVHLGTGTLLMRVLAAAGFGPRIIYRGSLDPSHRLPTPVFYLYMKLRIRYMIWVCRGKAIRVGGAGVQLRESIQAPGVGVIMVADAPVGPESPHRLRLLDGELPISRRGIDILAETGARYAPYTMVWDGDLQRRVMTIEPAAQAEDGDALFERYEAHTARIVERFGPQWQLWQVAHVVLTNRAGTDQGHQER